MEAMDFFIQSQNEKRASDKIKSVMIEYVLIGYFFYSFNLLLIHLFLFFLI